MSQTTLTQPRIDAGPGSTAGNRLLTLVHRPDGRLVGARACLDAREPLVLGRACVAFGHGALDDAFTSRAHAEVTLEGSVARVRDLGSRNGTTVNGAHIAGPVPLSPGDVVGVGESLLVLHAAPADFPDADHPTLLGRSPLLSEVLAAVAVVARRSTPVLVLGETGVGKELIARELHAASGRAGALAALNCGGMAENLLHSELFGHVRGAYSGADRERPGLVESARSGTLFLDEIGEASPPFQTSLLRLLQEGEYRPVGSDKARRAECRVVAATHRDLEAAVAAGTFRQDLFMRLARWTLRVPALRDRPDDILILAHHFAGVHGRTGATFTPALALALLRHGWPGNVRELDAVMERLVVEAGGARRLDLPGWFISRPAASLTAPGPAGAVEPVAPEPAQTRARGPKERPTPEALAAALRRLGGNMSHLAAELGIGRNTLYRWFEEAGLDPSTLKRS